MSIRVISRIWEQSQAKGAALLVLLAIGDFADDDGTAFPSISSLTKKARTSERGVQIALNQLIALGELKVERGAGPMGCNVYRVQSVRGAQSAGVHAVRGAKSAKKRPTPPQISVDPPAQAAPNPSEETRQGKGKPVIGKEPAAEKRAGVPDLAYDQFAAAHLQFLNSAYMSTEADFVQLARLRKANNVPARASPDGWVEAVNNYFASPLGSYTLADMVRRFPVLKNSALDGFNKPVSHAGGKRNGTGKRQDETDAEFKARKTREAGERILAKLDS